MARNVLVKAGGFFGEFKRFAIKGNALELAIAVVVGNAFSGIVNSLVADIITPLLGVVTNNVDFKTLAWTVRPEVVVKYGAFLQAIFNFVVVAFSIFVVFKLLSIARHRLFTREEAEPTPPQEKPAEERLLEEIRDLLKDQQDRVE
jgi:large conductance mechanosensitive channel